MPTPVQLVLGVAALVGLGGLFLFGRRLVRAWLVYRGTRIVVCPETREMVAIEVDARHAALSAPQGRPQLRLESCTRWPERQACGQECLGQVESAPEACLLKSILSDWTGFPPDQVIDVLASHQPACWDCRVAEGFRRQHPELVTDRRARPGPPPSMA